MVFPYKPTETGCIRLVRFLNDSGLNCAIENHSLASAPKYLALSYTWGRASYQKRRLKDDVYQITLNDQAFTIQQNLHDALRQLAKQAYAKDLYMWIDFICINQADMDERCQQVRLMRQIYEDAVAIYVWLSLAFDDEETKMAISLMESFSKYLDEAKKQHNDDMSKVTAGITTTTIGFPSPDRPDDIKAWDGIAEMLNQTYWRRTWIYQEASTPGEIWFCCGRHCFNAQNLSATVYFASIFSNLPGFPLLYSQAANSSSAAFSVNRARLTREKNDPKTSGLIDLLVGIRKAASTDPRDKVYAPLGLATDVPATGPTSIIVSYTASITEVYISVIRFALEQSGLSILAYVQMPAPEAAHAALRKVYDPAVPSWVVDWRQLTLVHPFDQIGIADGNVFNPCPDTTADYSIEGDNLYVKGLVFDTVKTTTTIWDDDEQSHSNVRAWHEALANVSSKVDDETFSRLIVADIQQYEVDEIVRSKRGGKADWQLLDTLPSKLDPLTRRDRDLTVYQMEGVCRARRAGLTSRDQPAIFPSAASPGDRIAAFCGGHLLYVIREVVGEENTYLLVGECYVDGMMDGECMADITDDDTAFSRLKFV